MILKKYAMHTSKLAVVRKIHHNANMISISLRNYSIGHVNAINGHNQYGYNITDNINNVTDITPDFGNKRESDVYVIGRNNRLKKVTEIKSILLLSNAFNTMSQSFWLHLIDKGYNVNFETVESEEDILNIYNEKVLNDTNGYNFDIILCPFLTKKIPSQMYSNKKGPKILIVHPGIKGDRGISSIDWRLLDPYNSNKGDGNYWGVTILEAHDEMDCGDIWSSINFDMIRNHTNYKFTKSNLYQKEIVSTALKCLDETLYKIQQGISPETLNYNNCDIKGTLRATMKVNDRQFEWKSPAVKISECINASSSRNGVLTIINNNEYYVYDAFIEYTAADLYQNELIPPGTVLEAKNQSILISTGTKPIWITTLKKKGKNNIKLPATMVLEDAELIPSLNTSGYAFNNHDIYYEIKNDVIYLHFDFFNGAFDTKKCIRLQMMLNEISSLKQNVIVLMGGYQYFSNGINLNTIENAKDCEMESFRNITAINNVIQTIFTSFTDKLVISAIHGNCGAGGVMLALAADIIWTHKHVIFNPHYKLIGLHGSEYWTEFFVKRVGSYNAHKLTDLALPISAKYALKIGLIDEIIGNNTEEFRGQLIQKLDRLNKSASFLNSLKEKYKHKRDLKWIKKAQNHLNNEMYKMLENFQNEEYKQNRHNFVHKIYKKRIVTNEDAQQLLSVVNNNNNNNKTSILDGKYLAKVTQNQLSENIEQFLQEYDRVPQLAIICVGFDDNLDLYTRNKIRTAQKIGMKAELIRLAEYTPHYELQNIISDLNSNDFVDGIIVQLPLPQHLNQNINEIMNGISPYKDVDGLTMFSNNKLKQDTLNIMCENNQLMKQLDIENYYKYNLDNNYYNIPCVPFGIMQCLNTFESLSDFNNTLCGKHAIIIGNSDIIGKPMTKILLSKGMTVTCTHKYTTHLSDLTCGADLVITATGVPNLLKKDWVKNGSVIFDVGIAYDANNNNELCGDVDINGLINYVHAISPVPGGIGPLTVSSVLSNTINSAKWRQISQTIDYDIYDSNHSTAQIETILNA